MDQAIRNKLRNVVTQSRKLLEEAVSQVLQGQFGIHAGAKKDEVHIEDEAQMKNLSEEDKGYRRDILAYLGHIQALGYKPKDALAQLVREIAFTHLNRLCAYKMMEAREVWIGGQRFREAVSRGLKSQGFQFYLADHSEDKKRFDSGHQDVAYRHFLAWLGALLSEEIGVLFSPTDPANRLFPPQRVLDDVLALLNSDDLKDIWSQDETIGWVYQYFTPKELRDQARKESQAPRNSYELAFRNQFFTPRYVVEFLTDNTLGRIWYEMRKGDTKLKDQCRYMVRRPREVFLAEGQKPPEPTQNQDGLSQEELLKQPVHIPYRPKKDPRELRILDPACGSGHFLLYCFDLLLTVYEEAYADPDLGPKLKEDYPTLHALRRDVPRLILAHNLHGIDIDLRATQIAAFALWLRSQRTYREMGLKQDRPRITKSNVVCAEPMPGEQEMLDEFLKTLKQDRLEALIRRVMQVPEGTRVRATQSMVESLAELVRLVWDKMQLAGEAGSLLKIEEELQEAVRKGQEEWEEKQPLFRFTEFSLTDQPKESYVRLVPGEGVSFWQRAEALVLEALRDYARHAANGGRLQRQLFAEDAAQGFAFIDLCQKRFDVVLMNPPFGDPSLKAKALVDKAYPRTKQDVYAAFIEMGLSRQTNQGRLGAITSRTGFFLSSFQRWREELLLSAAFPLVVADLGYGVLDAALVETAAYCLEVGHPRIESTFLRLLQATDKGTSLLSAVSTLAGGSRPDTVFVLSALDFKQVPGSPFAYWVSDRVRRLFRELPPLEGDGRTVKQGLVTGDNFRFVRCWWEVPPSRILNLADDPTYSSNVELFQKRCRDRTFEGTRWVPYAKGGEYSPYYSDIHLVVNWERDGQELRSFVSEEGGKTLSRPQNTDYYFRAGLTWPERTTSGYSAQVLPSGVVFSHVGQGIFLPTSKDAIRLLAVHNTRVFQFLEEVQIGLGEETVSGSAARHYSGGSVARLPYPAKLLNDWGERLEKLTLPIIAARRLMVDTAEPSWFFTGALHGGTSLTEVQRNKLEEQLRSCLVALKASSEIEALVRRECGVLDEVDEITAIVGPHPVLDLPSENRDAIPTLLSHLESQTIDTLIDRVVEEGLAHRSVTKKSYFVSRVHELLAQWGKCGADEVVECHLATKHIPLNASTR
jgi:hypothetical protein